MLDRIRHLKQDRMNNCGQTCVATITGMSIRDVEKAMGKAGKTNTKDLYEALESYGFTVPKKGLTRIGRLIECELPKLCIIKVVWKDRKTTESESHWVTHYDGKLYDPALNDVIDLDEYAMMFYSHEFDNFRPTSYLEVKEWA